MTSYWTVIGWTYGPKTGILDRLGIGWEALRYDCHIVVAFLLDLYSSSQTDDTCPFRNSFQIEVGCSRTLLTGSDNNDSPETIERRHVLKEIDGLQ